MTLIGNYFIKDGIAAEIKSFSPSVLQESETVYEVIRIIGGVPLFWKDHLSRFFESLVKTQRRYAFGSETIMNCIKKLIKINQINNGNIQFLISGDTRSFFAFEIKSCYPTKNDYLKGVRSGIYSAERSNPTAKVIKQDLRRSVNQIIDKKGWYEALLVDNNGFITEGSKSNAFFIEDDTVFTSPTECVLPGITRKYVIEACEKENIKIQELQLCVNKLAMINAAFITGTSPKVLPVCSIDKWDYDVNNPILQRIMRRYNEILEHNLFENRIEWVNESADLPK